MQEGVLHIMPVLGLCSHVGLCCYWAGNVIWPGWCEQSRWHIIMLLLSLLTDTPQLSLAAWQGCSRWSVPSLPFCSSLSSWHWRDLWKETPSGQVLLSFDVVKMIFGLFLGGKKRIPVHGPRLKTAVILHVPVCCYLGAVLETFPCVSDDSLGRKASNPDGVWKGRKGMVSTNSLWWVRICQVKMGECEQTSKCRKNTLTLESYELQLPVNFGLLMLMSKKPNGCWGQG